MKPHWKGASVPVAIGILFAALLWTLVLFTVMK